MVTWRSASWASSCEDELLHHLAMICARQRLEGDDGVQAVAEFRREHALDRLLVLAFALAAAEADAIALARRRRRRWWS